MSTMFGADSVGLDSLAGSMERAGAELTSMRGRLHSSLYGTTWNGKDADSFRSQWEGNFSPAMQIAAEFLVLNGQTLRVQANQQREASQGGGVLQGGSGSGGASAGYPPADPLQVFMSGFYTPSLLWDSYNLIGLISSFDPISKWIEATGPKIAQARIPRLLGPVGGGLTAAVGMMDLLYDHPYEGNHQILESVGDGLTTVGGVLLVFPPTAKVGFVLVAAGVAIDYGLQLWHNREQVAQSISNAANAAADFVASGVTTAASAVTTVASTFVDIVPTLPLNPVPAISAGAEVIGDVASAVADVVSDPVGSFVGLFR